MVNSLFQWMAMVLFTAVLNPSGNIKMAELKVHPLYISIIDINHNAKDKALEVSVRIFTDDFENTLKKYSNTKVDLTHPADKAAADKLVSNYILNKLQIKANGKPMNLHYVGFEQNQESIWVYFEATDVFTVQKIEVNSSILYDYQEKEINIIHAKVNGNEKSFRLDNPKSYAAFEW